MSSVLASRYAERSRPVGFYPLPTTRTETAGFWEGFRPFPMAAARKGLVYIHIPFCGQRCSFCRFYSGPFRPGVLDPYVASLRLELQTWGARRASDSGAGPVEAIYFGGGTPSILEPHHLDALLRTLRSAFDVVARPEVTLEWYPKDADEDRLAAARDLGVNRVSFGIQSWHRHVLDALGSFHSDAHCDAALEAARRCGFDNVNIDLMANVPGESLEEHVADVERALAWRPSKISLNPLDLVPGTPLAFKARRLGLQEDDGEKRRWLDTARSLLLGNGFSHQRARNLVRDDYLHRYNRATAGIAFDIVPIGVGAYGFYGGWALANASVMEEWAALVRDHGQAVVGVAAPSDEEMRRSFVICSLIELQVDHMQYFAQFGTRLCDDFPVVQELAAAGVFDAVGSLWRLTDAAAPYADDVCLEFYSARQRELFSGHLRVDRAGRRSQYFPVDAGDSPAALEATPRG